MLFEAAAAAAAAAAAVFIPKEEEREAFRPSIHLPSESRSNCYKLDAKSQLSVLSRGCPSGDLSLSLSLSLTALSLRESSSI